MIDPAPTTIRLFHAVHGHVVVNADDAEAIASWTAIGYSSEAIPVLLKPKRAKSAKAVDGADEGAG